MISIIIPVYNNENTIRAALKSVRSQSYRDYEVIIVNDGSTDGSASIIREFSASDPRFIYAEQAHRGLAAARNMGLGYASRRFVTFMDADGVLPPHALKRMHQIAITNDADTIIGNMNAAEDNDADQTKLSFRMTKKILRIDHDDPVLERSWSLGNKWLSREIIEAHGIRFADDAQPEDAVFLRDYYRAAQKIYSCPYPAYTRVEPLPAAEKSAAQKTGMQKPDAKKNKPSRSRSLFGKMLSRRGKEDKAKEEKAKAETPAVIKPKDEKPEQEKPEKDGSAEEKPEENNTVQASPKNKLKTTECYYNMDIRPNTVVVEGIGKRPRGSSLYLLRELTSGRYGDLDIFFPVTEETKELTKEVFEQEGFPPITLVEKGSDLYKEVLFTSEYLFNEVNQPFWWIKRPGQTYTNLWHGTPLKKLGKKKAGGIVREANLVRDYTSADYMLLPNEYSVEHILGDMDSIGITCASGLMLGYPRTGILFDQKRRDELRETYDLNGKTVAAWMPTWNDEKPAEDYLTFLHEMDEGLGDDQVLYVNLHHRTGVDIGYQSFRHIHSFPRELDIYEFLTAVDVLITDYSSIFFDFAVTRRKIILHCPDRDQYQTYRGLYMEPEALPFPVTANTGQLLDEIGKEKAYDDTAFLAQFNCYDSIDNARRLCDAILGKDRSAVEIREFPANTDATFILCDSFEDGVVTDYLFGIYEKGLWSDDFYLSFYEETAVENLEKIEPLIDNVRIYPTKDKLGPDLMERKRLYGDMKIRRFVLLDPISARRICRVSTFPEPVQLLLTKRQMDQLRADDEKMVQAVRQFDRYADGIYTLTEEDREWLQEELGISAETIGTQEEFYNTFFINK